MNIVDHSTAFPLVSRRPLARYRPVALRTRGRHQWHWFSPFKQLKVFVEGLALMSAGAEVKTTATTVIRMPFAASLGVVPSIASVNTPRFLTITAYFPFGCGPTNAAMTGTLVDGRAMLEVTLDTPSPDFACGDLALVPYTVEMTFTPSEEGDLPVRILTSDGVLVGESVVLTRGIKGNHAQFDVTGKWIDPAVKENGLAFEPDHPRDDTVVGTWNFHDCQGISHRYSIEGVHWREQDVEAEGAIFETTPNAANAPSPDLASTQLAAANQLGLARITFHGMNSARIFALGFGGSVLFTSNLIRTTQ